MASSAPLPPRDDPWYKATPGYETAAPGTILRLRVTPGDILNTFESASAVYNILYATTDSNYQRCWAVTTLFVPRATDAHALLSYHIPYNSANVDASPSFLLHHAGPQAWSELIDNTEWALKQGWHVVIADHEGPSAAVGDGLMAGHATLDSIRSVLNAGFGLDRTKTRIALWGYSGGAVASGWAAELQAHYAPELTLAGAALGGLPPDMTLIQNSSGGMFAGQVVLLLLGLTALCPPAFEELVAKLKPEKKEAFLAVKDYDLPKTFQTFAGQDVFDYFINGRGILEQPLIRRAMRRKGRMGHHGAPSCPLFIYKSIVDEVTSIEDTDLLVDKYSYVDANILYERNTIGGHMQEARFRKGGAREWVQSVLNGTHSHTGVTIKDVTIGG